MPDDLIQLKAWIYDQLILRHPGHTNQKTHGNRFGAGQAKESLRRLKDDKEARERYKAVARKKQGLEAKPERKPGTRKPSFDAKKLHNTTKLVDGISVTASHWQKGNEERLYFGVGKKNRAGRWDRGNAAYDVKREEWLKYHQEVGHGFKRRIREAFDLP